MRKCSLRKLKYLVIRGLSIQPISKAEKQWVSIYFCSFNKEIYYWASDPSIDKTTFSALILFALDNKNEEKYQY